MKPHSSCCRRPPMNSSVPSTCQYETTAITLTANRPRAPMRPPIPRISRIGKDSSPKVPTTAASTGGRTGVWYSVRNRSSVWFQLVSLSQPDARKTWLTYRRVANDRGACNQFIACERAAISRVMATMVIPLLSRRGGEIDERSQRDDPSKHSVQGDVRIDLEGTLSCLLQ